LHLLSTHRSIIFDIFRYTRNLVDAGNGKFNLMILCWGEGHGSAIHDHADSHCFMKMLKGQLSEIRFAWPNDKQSIDSATADITIIDDEINNEYDGNELQELSRSTMEENGVCYINGEREIVTKQTTEYLTECFFF
jgi:cysteine dioxygenase